MILVGIWLSLPVRKTDPEGAGGVGPEGRLGEGRAPRGGHGALLDGLGPGEGGELGEKGLHGAGGERDGRITREDGVGVDEGEGRP